MNDFTTTANFQITSDETQAALLFEQVETFGNGVRFHVQEKNENGRWGGMGTDAEFTVYNTSPTREEVIEQYREHYCD